MTRSTSSPSARATRGLPRASLRPLIPFLALGFLALPVPGAAQAGSGSPAVQDLFVDELGCSGCHGRSGEGGLGPTLQNSPLSLPLFLKQIRLPSDVMPPFSPTLASDAQLAAIYGWLDGTDAVASPPPVVVEVEVPGDAAAGEETELGVTARAAETGGEAPGPGERTPLRYRLTLLSEDNTPVAGHGVSYRLPGADGWVDAKTGDDGRALLGPEEGAAAARLLGDGGATTGVRIALPAGRHALVVEALDWSEPSAAAALGVGTAVFDLE